MNVANGGESVALAGVGDDDVKEEVGGGDCGLHLSGYVEGEDGLEGSMEVSGVPRHCRFLRGMLEKGREMEVVRIQRRWRRQRGEVAEKDVDFVEASIVAESEGEAGDGLRVHL